MLCAANTAARQVTAVAALICFIDSHPYSFLASTLRGYADVAWSNVTLQYSMNITADYAAGSKLIPPACARGRRGRDH
jgi:hypothetical protein